MMSKIFNKKIAKLYIAMICVSIVVALVSTGFCLSFSSQYDELLAASTKSDSSLADLGSALLSALGGDTDKATEGLTNALTSLLGGDSANSISDAVAEELEALKTKKNVTLVLLIVFYVLTVVFSAGTIICFEYERYLQSPKYKAKLKRLKKYEKIKNN